MILKKEAGVNDGARTRDNQNHNPTCKSQELDLIKLFAAPTTTIGRTLSYKVAPKYVNLPHGFFAGVFVCDLKMYSTFRFMDQNCTHPFV